MLCSFPFAARGYTPMHLTKESIDAVEPTTVEATATTPKAAGHTSCPNRSEWRGENLLSTQL